MDEQVMQRDKVIWSLKRMMHSQLTWCWMQWREATKDSVQEGTVRANGSGDSLVGHSSDHEGQTPGAIHQPPVC